MDASAIPVSAHPLDPPSLEDIASTLRSALQKNYRTSSVTVVPCPDLRQAPFHLASAGLCGREVAADIGGQPHLFPTPLLEKKYSLIDCAQQMGMSPAHGQLLGAGAGPFHVVGKNSELAPNLAWTDGYEQVQNLTQFAAIEKQEEDRSSVVCRPCPGTDCALMMNLYGSDGHSGPVLKITARERTGSGRSFTDFVRQALHDAYGDARQVTLGGTFIIKSGTALYHVMPDFPPADKLPWTDRHELNRWLTYHRFGPSMVCLTVFHSADTEDLNLRMEHTHCFSSEGFDRGGHYHYDLLPGDEGSAGEEIEYEAYFNTVKTLYRIDRPNTELPEDLHD